MSALREILAKFGVEFETDQLEKGHRSVEGMIGQLEHLGASVAVAFGLHEIREWYDSLTEGAIKLKTQAETIGMSADQLQLWQYAAERSHISADGFSMSLNRLQSQLYMAAQGNPGIQKMFSRVGLSAKDAEGNVKDVGEFLDDFANKVQGMANEGEKKQLVKMLFGRGGFRLLPLLNQGAEGIKKLKAEFQALGGGYTDDFIEKSEEVHGAQMRVSRVFQALNIQILSKFLPYIEKAAHYVEGFVRQLTALERKGAVTNAVLALLTGMLIVKFPIILGFITKLASMISLPTVLFAALVLLVDELITTFQGGDTYVKDFVDSIFGDGATAKIVENIKTVSSEVAGLLTNFEQRSESASDLSLGILALIQTIGLVFTATFGVVEAAGRLVWRMLGDLEAVLHNVIVGAAKAAQFLGLYGGDTGDFKKMSSDKDYLADIDKGLGSSADRVADLFKTFGAMGNQQQPGQPASLGAALAAAGEVRPDVAAFMASQGKPATQVTTNTTVHQTNNFTLPPGSKPDEVKKAVSEANKETYRAAEANLVHKVEG